jgi:tetratricopeptide (TPR) repeat protein
MFERSKDSGSKDNGPKYNGSASPGADGSVSPKIDPQEKISTLISQLREAQAQHDDTQVITCAEQWVNAMKEAHGERSPWALDAQFQFAMLCRTYSRDALAYSLFLEFYKGAESCSEIERGAILVSLFEISALGRMLGFAPEAYRAGLILGRLNKESGNNGLSETLIETELALNAYTQGTEWIDTARVHVQRAITHEATLNEELMPHVVARYNALSEAFFHQLLVEDARLCSERAIDLLQRFQHLDSSTVPVITQYKDMLIQSGEIELAANAYVDLMNSALGETRLEGLELVQYHLELAQFHALSGRLEESLSLIDELKTDTEGNSSSLEARVAVSSKEIELLTNSGRWQEALALSESLLNKLLEELPSALAPIIQAGDVHGDSITEVLCELETTERKHASFILNSIFQVGCSQAQIQSAYLKPAELVESIGWMLRLGEVVRGGGSLDSYPFVGSLAEADPKTISELIKRGELWFRDPLNAHVDGYTKARKILNLAQLSLAIEREDDAQNYAQQVSALVEDWPFLRYSPDLSSFQLDRAHIAIGLNNYGEALRIVDSEIEKYARLGQLMMPAYTTALMAKSNLVEDNHPELAGLLRSQGITSRNLFNTMNPLYKLPNIDSGDNSQTWLE